jgi:hypothetical protein
MMESPPSAALVMGKAKLPLEFLVVSFDPPTHLGGEDPRLQGDVGWKGERKYLLGSFSPSGHSISSHSSGRGPVLRSSRWAGETRKAANQEIRRVWAPSRQVTGAKAAGGKASARAFIAQGFVSRRPA